MAREVVQITAYASAAATAVPMPFTDLALLLPFHTAMVLTVSHCMGRRITDAEARKVAVELGAVVGATVAGRLVVGLAVGALKFILPIGGLVAAPASFAVTWGFGQLTIAYFEDPERTRDDLRALFNDSMKDGYRQFSKEALDRLRNVGFTTSTDSTGGETPVSPADPRRSSAAKSSPPSANVPVQNASPSSSDTSSSPPERPSEASKTNLGADIGEEGALRTKKRSL